MKKAIFSLIMAVLTAFLGFSQTTIQNIEYFSPEQEGVFAIKKGDQWGFIGTSGNLIIPLRDDLVASKNNNEDYPIFKDGKCLIKKEIEGVTHFGFIDKNGKTIIEPQFINVTNFNKGKAIILKKATQKIGQNNVLGKTLLRRNWEDIILVNAEKFGRFLIF